jgi:hypothetical protein
MLAVSAAAAAEPERERLDANTPAASFVDLPHGWHAYRDAQDSTALNWRWRPNSNGWAASMPRGGIAVNVYFPHPQQKQHYGPLRLVLPKRPSTLLEGTRDTPEYRIYGRVHGFDVNIFVDIRRVHPSRADLRSARLVAFKIRFS